MNQFGRVLPNRKHIIFSNNPDFKIENENVEVVNSLLEIQDLINSDEEVFVIGGSMIYNLLMPYVKKMYITEINEEFEGDSFFPKIDKAVWKEISRVKGVKNAENDLDYDFVVYERIN